MMREDGIDTIRVLLTFLVVIHHVAMVYGGAEGWYWSETGTQHTYLYIFNIINQSFFMGFFFLLVGYFSRSSLKRKGVNAFLKDRLIRLGIPLLVYFFVISPVTIALANSNPDVSLMDQTLNMIKAKEFEPGPLWFLFSLLIFSVVLSIIHCCWPKLIGSFKRMPSSYKIAVSLTCIAVFTFVVRLIMPVGQKFIWLQLGHFPMYILFFIVGVFSSEQRLLFSIEFHRVKIWLVVSVVLMILLPFALMHPPGTGSFEGGANINALFYAFWEPFVACGVIFGFLLVFNTSSYNSNSFFKFLSPLTYCLYIIHSPVVVFISVALRDWNADLLIKFFTNSCISIAVCIILSFLILKLPYVRRVL